MEYLMLVPVVIVTLYGLLFLSKQQKHVKIIITICSILLSVIVFFILRQYLMLSENLLFILLVNTVMWIIFARLENKMTSLFLLIYMITIGILSYIGFSYNNVIVYTSFLIALIFLLAENNQLFMKKTYEQSATEYQNKILNKQVEEVQNIYLTMRSWRHDYHNHLQKLKAHIMMDQVKEANQYLNELEVDLDNVNQLVESGNINLDAILNSKLSLAIKNNININFDANVPKKLTITDIDLCVMIGNLIDNAVEACEKITDDTSKFIRVYIGIFKKQLYVSITNSTNEVIKKLDAEYISKKRGNHGHGLKRINNIVDKYSGFINRQNEPKVFVTEVLLPL